MTKTVFAFVAAAMIAAPAVAQVADVQWSPSGEASHEFSVAPGKFAEWCAKLQRGDKVKWRFDAPAALDFNVHYHEGRDVRFPAKIDGAARAEGTLEAGLDQGYCWMWTNKSSAPVAVRVSATRSR